MRKTNKISYILSIISNLVLLFSTHVDGESGCGCGKRRKYFGSSQKNAVCFNPDFRYVITRSPTHNMIRINGDTYAIGTNQPVIVADGEAPERKVIVRNFYIDKYEVSNSDFARFVEETGFKTDAEKYGDSFVLYSLVKDLKPGEENVSAVAAVPWWLSIKKTDWRHPEGPNSSIKGYKRSVVVVKYENIANITICSR